VDPADAWRTLYAAAPEDFVKERDRLARELKAAGQGDAAAALKKAKKPALPVWALNQVAQARRELIEDLLEAGAAMADVHQALAEGGKAAADFKGSAAGYRQAIAAVVAAARAALEDAGHGADAGALRRIERSLEALPFADATQRQALREGHLGDELARAEAGDGLALEAALMASASAASDGAKAAPSERRPAPRPSGPPQLSIVRPAPVATDAALARKRREDARARRAEADQANRAATAAEQAARDLRDELTRARKLLDDAHAAVAAAEAKLAAERDKADAARDKIRALESHSAAAARAATEAKSAAERAESVAATAERLADGE
jgi:hypothetical protein